MIECILTTDGTTHWNTDDPRAKIEMIGLTHCLTFANLPPSIVVDENDRMPPVSMHTVGRFLVVSQHSLCI